MRPDVTLISPTRDRPEAFSLCVKWMMRQTFSGSVHWLIVDDGDTPVDPIKSGLNQMPHRWEVERIRREPSKAVCTLQDNLLEAIPRIKSHKVLIIEDDENYVPAYVRTVSGLLEDADLAGEKNARYYNVTSRRWWCPNNQRHASLCRTGLRASLLPHLIQACELSKLGKDVFVDLRLWGVEKGLQLPKDVRTTLLPGGSLSVGIKGMPGRGGLGKSHGWNVFPNRDPKMDKLREWIGEDAKEYERFANMRLVAASR